MIQSIKMPVITDGEKYAELSLDYDEAEDYVCIYLDGKYLFGMNYNDNLKQAMKKMIEKW